MELIILGGVRGNRMSCYLLEHVFATVGIRSSPTMANSRRDCVYQKQISIKFSNPTEISDRIPKRIPSLCYVTGESRGFRKFARGFPKRLTEEDSWGHGRRRKRRKNESLVIGMSRSFDRHGCLSVSGCIPCICNRTPKMDARR